MVPHRREALVVEVCQVDPPVMSGPEFGCRVDTGEDRRDDRLGLRVGSRMAGPVAQPRPDDGDEFGLPAQSLLDVAGMQRGRVEDEAGQFQRTLRGVVGGQNDLESGAQASQADISAGCCSTVRFSSSPSAS